MSIEQYYMTQLVYAQGPYSGSRHNALLYLHNSE